MKKSPANLKDETIFLSTTAAGKLLGIHAQTVRRYIREGWLKGFSLPTGQMRVRRADVEAMAAGLRRA